MGWQVKTVHLPDWYGDVGVPFGFERKAKNVRVTPSLTEVPDKMIKVEL